MLDWSMITCILGAQLKYCFFKQSRLEASRWRGTGLNNLDLNIELVEFLLFINFTTVLCTAHLFDSLRC